MNNWTWKDEAYEVLKILGGHAYFEDIYTLVRERRRVNITTEKSMRASIRDTIQRYSSDSDKFLNKEDLFYAVDGKGGGHWGIREFQLTDTNIDLTQDDAQYVEGKISLRKHIVRERNPELIKKAKKKFREEHNGKLYCEVCEFNFEDKYGKLGEGFIEAHHTKPVSQMIEGEKTKVEDIAMLCSNCHSMIHRKRPWLTKNELKTLIEK